MTAGCPVLADRLCISDQVLNALMPMHLRVNGAGIVVDCGPTISKMVGAPGAPGRSVFSVIEFRRPEPATDMAGLVMQAGQRLTLALKAAPGLPLRGIVTPLPGGGGAVIDISLGLSFQRGVAEFGLTLGDFSPCDQTVELLYLYEANASIARLSRHLTERLRVAREEAEAQALSDALTGLSNRRAVDLALTQMLEDRLLAFSVLHIDLDLFKAVNDTHGHAAGDRILQEVGIILRADLRAGDIAGRIGGDEFLVILSDTDDLDALASIATRLIQRLERPVPFGDAMLQVSASIGIARTVDYDIRPSIDVLLADTDLALYRAKNTGRGRWCVHGAADDPPPRRRVGDG